MNNKTRRFLASFALILLAVAIFGSFFHHFTPSEMHSHYKETPICTLCFVSDLLSKSLLITAIAATIAFSVRIAAEKEHKHVAIAKTRSFPMLC